MIDIELGDNDQILPSYTFLTGCVLTKIDRTSMKLGLNIPFLRDL